MRITRFAFRELHAEQSLELNLQDIQKKLLDGLTAIDFTAHKLREEEIPRRKAECLSLFNDIRKAREEAKSQKKLLKFMIRTGTGGDATPVTLPRLETRTIADALNHMEPAIANVFGNGVMDKKKLDVAAKSMFSLLEYARKISNKTRT